MFRRIKGPLLGSLVCFCLAIAALTLAHRGLPSGAYSDLYLPWYGARALLLERRNPYTDAVTHQIQVGYFDGHIPAWAPPDLQADAYPAHSALLLAPTLGWPFPLVARGYSVLFLLLLPLLTVATLWPLLRRGSDVGHAPALQPDLPGALLPDEAPRGTGSPRRPSMAMGWGLLAAASWSLYLPFWDTLYLGQPTGAVLACLLGALLCQRLGREALAGALLALATIKPQLMALLAGALIVEALARRRLALPGGFLITLVALLAESLAARPTWPSEYLAASRAYTHSYGVRANLWRLLPAPVALACAVALVAGCLLVWGRLGLRRYGAPGWRHGQASALAGLAVLATTVQVAPMPYPAPYTQLPLWPALLGLGLGAWTAWGWPVTYLIRAGAALALVSLLGAAALGPWLGGALRLSGDAASALTYNLAAGHLVGLPLAAATLLIAWRSLAAYEGA